MNISTVELLDWLVKASYLVAATLFSYFALARRKWQQGESND